MSEAEKKAESEAKEQAAKAVTEALAGTELTDDQKAEIQSKVKDSISISGTTDMASGKIAEAKDALKDMPDLEIPELSSRYKGSVEEDRYGRRLPKAAHGTQDLGRQTSSTKLITKAVTEIFDRTVNKELFVRRMYVVANHVVKEETVSRGKDVEQLSFFVDFEAEDKKREEESRELERERRAQEAILSIKKRYGKNAILKGMNLEEGATGAERNSSIGGHKA